MNDELVGRNSTLVWDGLSNVELRYHPQTIKHKSGHAAQLAQSLGHRTVPVEALAGVDLTLPKDGQPRLRLVLRENADPVVSLTGADPGRHFDPYLFYYHPRQELLAEYYATEIRTAIRLAQMGAGPADRFLVAAPKTADELNGFDGRLRVDGRELRFTWKWCATPAKKSGGKRHTISLDTVSGVEYRGWRRMDNAHLRLLPAAGEPEDDPNTLLIGAYEVPAILFGARLLEQLRPRW